MGLDLGIYHIPDLSVVRPKNSGSTGHSQASWRLEGFSVVFLEAQVPVDSFLQLQSHTVYRHSTGLFGLSEFQRYSGLDQQQRSEILLRSPWVLRP